MLAISNGAAQMIRQVVSSAQIPQEGGVRITAEPVDGETVRLDLSIAASPEPGDAVVEEEGAKVFVDQEIAPLLDGKVLDAKLEADQVAFSISEKPQDWSGDGQPENFDPRNIG